VDREAADVVAGEFDLTSVAPGADLQAELANGRGQRLGAADGPGGPVEGRQQAVPGGVDVAAPVPFDLPAREVVMPDEQVGPPGIAEFGEPLSRADDGRPLPERRSGGEPQRNRGGTRQPLCRRLGNRFASAVLCSTEPLEVHWN